MVTTRWLGACCCCWTIFACGGQSIAAEPLRFAFGRADAVAGFTAVAPDESYSAERGFGFEPGGKVAAGSGFCTSEQPFFFSVKAPEGNYRVTVTLGDSAGEATTTVKAELRRLMLENVQTKSETVRRTFIVNVRTPQIAG